MSCQGNVTKSRQVTSRHVIKRELYYALVITFGILVLPNFFYGRVVIGPFSSATYRSISYLFICLFIYLFIYFTFGIAKYTPAHRKYG